MNLYEKIINIYPNLTQRDFFTVIQLMNDSNGTEDYISMWSHPVYPQPTQAQLDGVN